MGYKLYREIRDRAPADWTHAERLVAWVIADDANDETRRSWIKLPELMERTGIKSQSGVRQALQKLADRGYEFRMPFTRGRDGRLVFAARGHSLDYLMPPMPERRLNRVPLAKGDSSECPSASKGDSSESPLSSGKPSLLNGRKDMVSRRARAKRERVSARTIDEVIEATRDAAVEAYGTADVAEVSDDEWLGLYFTHKGKAEVHDVRAYMGKIFGDAPYLDTFLANSEPVCVTCVKWESDCQCASSLGQPPPAA